LCVTSNEVPTTREEEMITGQEATLRGWQGNVRSDVALATRHRWLNGLRKRDEDSA